MSPLTPFPARFVGPSDYAVSTVLSSTDAYGALHAALNLMEDSDLEESSVTLHDPANPDAVIATISIGPASAARAEVFVVAPDEHGPAVFERREDAERFAGTYGEPGDMFGLEAYRVTLATPDIAAEMIRDRSEEA